LIEMGRVAGSHGVHGWVRVRPWSGAPEGLAGCPVWRIGEVEYKVEETRIHSGTLLARLAGVASRETALKLKGAIVAVPREALAEPEQGRYYWADLVGLEVVNSQGMVLGVVREMFSHGAHDVMELSGDRPRLLPWVPAVVKRVDLEAKRIEVEWGADW
jgi:16S rRNA processing protein RimM